VGIALVRNAGPAAADPGSSASEVDAAEAGTVRVAEAGNVFVPVCGPEALVAALEPIPLAKSDSRWSDTALRGAAAASGCPESLVTVDGATLALASKRPAAVCCIAGISPVACTWAIKPVETGATAACVTGRGVASLASFFSVEGAAFSFVGAAPFDRFVSAEASEAAFSDSPEVTAEAAETRVRVCS
jgi:hypothetical protein